MSLSSLRHCVHLPRSRLLTQHICVLVAYREARASKVVAVACLPCVPILFPVRFRSAAFCRLALLSRFRMKSCTPSMSYPSLQIAPRHDVQDNFHGTEVSDPYRWLEDVDSKETKSWVDEQVKITNSWIETSCSSMVSNLNEKLSKAWNYERTSCPFQRGSKFYFWHNEGLQNQSVLYGQESLEAEPYVVIDPNVIEEDGTAAVLSVSFAESGNLLVYSISRSGSDWRTLQVLDTNTCKNLPDTLQWVKFSSIAWTRDEKGFFYCRYPKPATFEKDFPKDDVDVKRGKEVDAARHQSVYYHCLGESQESDVCIWAETESPDYMFGVEVSDCGDYLILTTSDSCDPVNKLFVAPLDCFDPKTPQSLKFLRIVNELRNEYSYITNEASRFYFRTNLDAPRYRLVSIDIAEAVPKWEEVIPQKADVLEFASCANGNQLLVGYVHDVKSILQLFNLDGKFMHDIQLPDTCGQVVELQAKKKLSQVFYKFQSFVHAGTICRLDLPTLEGSVYRDVKVAGIDPNMFKTEQVFFESKDGTRVPMFIISRTDRDSGKPAPTVLYGYGGFNISLLPSFSVSRLVFVKHFNAVFAIANLRGGGEYGDDWHRSGTKERKQNVFDDFQCASEYLISMNYCTPSTLSIMGGSNGGLLVAATVNQRPDLYACAIAQVGVMDMLRFHRFTIGYAWCSDYGNAEVSKEEFESLFAYSPLHNVKFKTSPYPAMMLCTADHDDRVVPLHSFKLAATLQHEIGQHPLQVKPLLCRIDVKAGHGAGKPLSKTIQECAEIYAFIAHHSNATFQ